MVALGGRFTRTPIADTFQSTMNQCFTTVVEDILGRTVREEIKSAEISSRFDEVIEVLTRIFGISAQVLLYKTVAELYKEYSLRSGFAFGESLKDQVASLREKVVSDLLKPRHYASIDP